MGNCKDCKHWTAPQKAMEHGTCERADFMPPEPMPPMFAEGGDFSFLRTLPTFGCVEFEAKGGG